MGVLTLVSCLCLVGEVLCAALGGFGDFEKGVRCGSNKFCKPTEYCTEFTSSCKPCNEICDEAHHNRDEVKCKEDCQQYLKLMYLEALNANYTELKGEVRNYHNNVTTEIRNLYYLVSVSVTFTCLILIGLAVFFLLRFLRWRKKRKITLAWISAKLFPKKKAENHNQAVSVTNASGKLDLRLEMPQSAQQTAGTPPSTASTGISSTRRPTEDTTLDYAYDNPAMATTPSPNRTTRPPHESSL